MEIVTFVELDLDVTYRFGYASEQQIDYDHIPSLKSVSVRPAVLNPGESIGEREQVTIQCIDHLHRFDVDNFDDGTFWTKFRARYVSIEGAPLRVKRGIRGQALADMDTYLYVADKFQISRTGATLTAKDPLTLLGSKAAQAPKVTTGELSAPLTAVAMAFTLTPAGIGNLQYPAGPAKGVLGGTELITFTRVGDNFTIVSRGENVPAQAHDEDTKFQLALWYDGEVPSFIINDLLTNYSNVDPAWITIADWQTAVDNFVNRVYTTIIAEPTSVKTLLDELCEQIGLIFYWDPFAKQIRLKPILAAATSQLVDETRIMEGSFTSVEQPEKRVSQIWTYYGQRDPTKKIDETNNYRRVLVNLAPNEGDFAQPAIRKIFSRWIPFQGRTTAQRLNELMISRYQIPPRKFNFNLFRNQGVTLPPIGVYLDVEHWFLVDANGLPETPRAQITSVSHADAEVEYEAEEIRFAGEELDPEVDKYVFIETDVFNINLRTLYDQIYNAPNTGDNVYFIVESGARVGGLIDPYLALTPSMDVGNWPEACNLFLYINGGRVQGIGGKGGGSKSIHPAGPFQGSQGGTALYTRRAITIKNTGGKIWGGGGGGGVNPSISPGGISGPLFQLTSVGGGGAGFTPGSPGDTAAWPFLDPIVPATTEAGGSGTGKNYTNGGGPGQPGFTFAPFGILGGAAGVAIDGISFVTFDGAPGSILGQQIN